MPFNQSLNHASRALVSVIVPCYNAMQFLPKTLSSALQQTYYNFEVILVNDGSTDPIKAWASELQDNRVRLISQANKGLAGARNTGIEHARGEYIAFLDADDLWHPEKLARQVAVLAADAEAGFVYTWALLIDEGDRPLRKTWTISEEGNVWPKIIEGNIIACGSVPMIRRACIETVGLFADISLCEDWDFWLRMAAHYPFRVVEEILVFYRETSGSLSRAEDNGMAQKLREMDKSYHFLIDRAFAKTSSELWPLAARSHALVNIQIAWIALKSHQDHYKHFEYYKNRAVARDPKIVSLLAYKKLIWAARFIRFWGPQNYKRLKALPPMPLSIRSLVRSADVNLKRVVGY